MSGKRGSTWHGLTETERFWRKVLRSDYCWVWLAGKNVAGYGIFGVAGTSVLAHRWAFESAHGPVPG